MPTMVGLAGSTVKPDTWDPARAEERATVATEGHGSDHVAQPTRYQTATLVALTHPSAEG